MTNLDEDTPDSAESFETAAPAAPALPRVTAPPLEISPELAVVSAIMGDADGIMFKQAQGIPLECWEDAVARTIWAVWRAGVDPTDVVKLALQAKLPMLQVLAIAEADRAGATFAKGLALLRGRAYHLKAKSLAAQLAEDPDRTPEIARQLAELTELTEYLPARTVDEFKLTAKDAKDCLLGNHYLDRGGGLVLASNSGMGKSSLMMQMAVIWALGRDFHGLAPNGPLKSLIVQSEDSDNDIAEVLESIYHVLKLTADQRKLLRERIVVVTDKRHRGDEFVSELRHHVRVHRPDLVWINPLAAFMAGDISSAEEAGKFLREQLNELNAEQKFAYILVHHTTKPGDPKKGEAKWSEIQYGMAGSYELIGWARGIIILKPADNPGEFNLVFAKRGTRTGIMVDGESESGLPCKVRTTTIPLQHSTGTFRPPGAAEEIPIIFWENRTVPRSETVTRKRKNSIDLYIPIIPQTREKALGIRALHRFANDLRPIAISSFILMVEAAVIDGFLACDRSNPKLPVYWFNAQPK